MTFEQFERAKLLLAEERFGSGQRASIRAENAQVEATKAAIRKAQGL